MTTDATGAGQPRPIEDTTITEADYDRFKEQVAELEKAGWLVVPANEGRWVPEGEACCGPSAQISHVQSQGGKIHMGLGERCEDNVPDLDRLMELWQLPWTEERFGEAQVLLSRLRGNRRAEPPAGTVFTQRCSGIVCIHADCKRHSQYGELYCGEHGGPPEYVSDR